MDKQEQHIGTQRTQSHSPLRDQRKGTYTSKKEVEFDLDGREQNQNNFPSPNQNKNGIPPTVIQKEISKGVFFVKEFVAKQNPSGFDQFVFSIKNTTLKDIDFTCNFKGSEKVEINTT